MDASKLDEQVRAALLMLACNVAKSIVYTLADDWLSPLVEDLLGAAGLPNPASCPG